MSRRCEICKKGPVSGRKYKRRGMVRRKGGAGAKIVGKTLRTFLPNIQNVRAKIDGVTRKVAVCTRCLKAGKITKV